MITKVYTHGFDQPLSSVFNYTTDYFYIIERPFDSLSGAILKSVKLVGSATYKTPRIKIALLEETNKYKEYKIVWIGQLLNDGKYGNNIYYIEGLNVKCPKETYVAVLYEKGQNEYCNSLYTDARNQPWYCRRFDKLTFNDYQIGLVLDSKDATVIRSGFHFPMQFEFDVFNKPKILFQDESGEYKVFKHEEYVNLVKFTQTNSHISSSATHPNHPDSLLNCFDGDENTYWVSDTGNTFPKYIKYDFGVPTTIDRFEMMPAKMPNNANHWGIGYWTLLGSNDDSVYTEIYKSDNTTAPKNRDYYNYLNGGQLRYVNFPKSKPTYRYYKIEFRSAYNTSSPYDYVIAVSHIGFMKLREKGWESIGTTAGVNEFVQYGMSVEEVEMLTQDDLSQLQGVYSVKVFVEDTSIDKVSIIKDKEEVIWLENKTTDVFEVVRYTENDFLDEAKFVVDNGKRTLYDYFSKDIDVSVYSEDTNTSDKMIELTQSYSPLDELNGDIEVYEYSDLAKNIVKGEKTQLQEDFIHRVDGAYVDSVDIDLNDANTGKAKKIINY
jgi:hypothetical protein